MDCDRVFVVLTSRPFPSGSPDDSLIECHLLDCDGCRQIAEALRPGDNVSHESLPAAERRSLPQYHRKPSPVATVPSAMEARLYSTQSKPGPNRREAAPSPPRPAAKHRINGLARQQQLAAFSLAPQRQRNRLAEVVSLAAIVLLVAIVGWGLGWLTM